MALQLFGHPFSSYHQKALIAFYENDIEFDFRLLGPDDPATAAEFEQLWPIGRFPVLRDGQLTIVEATVIIEHLSLYHPGPVELVPADPRMALGVRMLDRFFDNYIMTPMQKIVTDAIRTPEDRDPFGVNEARAMLGKAYRWLDRHLQDREWSTEAGFSMADCAAAPALFYADWAHPIDAAFGTVRRYRERLLARPSFQRAVDEARPYRPFFPLGAPDRD